MGSVLLAFGAIFLAELGDKSQLVAATFATRYAPAPVLVAVAVASLLVQGLSVAIGALLSLWLPENAIAVAAGCGFLAFAIWNLVDRDEAPRDEPRPGGGLAVLTVASALVVGEIGDKTMLATAALATREGWLTTWIGASAGMFAADGIAVALGRQLGERLPQRVLRLGATVVFAVVGVTLLVGGLIA